MNAERPHALKAASLAVTLGLTVALTACGPAKPPGDSGKDAAVPAAGAPAAPTPTPATVNLDTLKGLEVLEGTNWDLAEGVSIAEAGGEAPMAGWKSVTLTGDATTGFHRIGLSRNFGGGAKTYQITVWVKASPGVDAMLETRGKALEADGQPVDYGVAYFDLTNGALAANKLVNEKTKLAKSAISRDGEWQKLTGNITTTDGWVFLVVGMVSKGQHVFTGSTTQQLTIGGMELKPV